MQPRYHTLQPRAGFPWLPVLLVVGGVVLAGLITTGFFVWYVLQEPKGLTVEVSLSDAIYVSQPFELVVSVTNVSSETKHIDSIEFENTLLEQVQVLSCDPAWKRVEPVPLIGKSYVFRRSLAPGEKVEFKFVLSTERTGWYFTTIAVYVGIGFQATLHDIEFAVESRQ